MERQRASRGDDDNEHPQAPKSKWNTRRSESTKRIHCRERCRGRAAKHEAQNSDKHPLSSMTTTAKHPPKRESSGKASAMLEEEQSG
jgi:hypothetical protein